MVHDAKGREDEEDKVEQRTDWIVGPRIPPFKTPLQPYASYAALFVVALLALTNGFPVFFPGRFNASGFLAAYITIPIFLALYLGHKIVRRTPLARPLAEVDVITGEKEMEEMKIMEGECIPRNWVDKAWHYIA